MPFSEAVATFVPFELKAIAANGLSCAGIIVLACCIIEKFKIVKISDESKFLFDSFNLRYLQDGSHQISGPPQSYSILGKLHNNCHYLAKVYKDL